jgi:hypothetical protein
MRRTFAAEIRFHRTYCKFVLYADLARWREAVAAYGESYVAKTELGHSAGFLYLDGLAGPPAS